MPRGKKSKLRAREKRHHDRAQTKDLKDAQAATAEEGEATSSPSPDVCEGPSSSTVACSLPAPPSVPATTSSAAGASSKGSDAGARSRGKKSKNPSRASTHTASSGPCPISKEASTLGHWLLYKYTMNEPIRKADMPNIVQESYREQFPQILRKASVYLDLLFDLELKEIKPNSHLYNLVCISDKDIGRLGRAWRFPTRGILMSVLGLIYMYNNHIPEKKIWEFLNMWGIYDGKRHFLFGEPRKLITQDLVNENYLEYNQVPNSDPPRFEFLWGSRAHAETSKMEVLEFWSKVGDTTPSDFPYLYEEALRDEEERARAAAATMAGPTSKASGDFRATSSHCSHLNKV